MNSPRQTLSLLVVLAAFSGTALAFDVVDDMNEDVTASTGFTLAEDPMPEILTATRLRQSKYRTPGTVTVIEGDLIRDLGLLHLWEVFRLVPGMTVGSVGSNEPVVSYHGTVAREQRRLQVLVDGRSQYNPSLANVDWVNMPVPLEAIERIEVSRGPNAATYGANSFLAVINIITHSPQDTHGVELRAVNGNRGFGNYYGAVGDQVGSTDWRLSFLSRRSDGFDWRPDRDATGSRTDDRVDFRNSYDVTSLNFSSTTEVGHQDQISVNAGLHDVYHQEDIQDYIGFGVVTNPDRTGQDWYGQLRWDHEAAHNRFFHIQAYYQQRERERGFRGCFNEMLIANLRFLDTQDGITTTSPDDPFCANTNEDLEENRAHIEFQETRLFAEGDQLVYGASYREDWFDSDTFFNGRENKHLTQVFANLDRRLTPWLTTNVGAMWEKDSVAGNFVSPRGALNIQLSHSQVLRMVVSRAYRLPDAFEQSADWGYRATNFDPEAPDFENVRLIAFQAPGNLEEERILSREISYFTQTRQGRGIFSGEVKLFRDTLSQVISGRTNINEWDLENNVELNQRGVELEASADWPRNYLRLSYAYFEQEGRYTGTEVDDPAEQQRFIDFESRMNAQHSGSASLIHRFPANTTGAVSYYVTDSLRNRRFERVDFRLARSLYFSQFSMEVAAIMQHYRNDKPLYNEDNNLDSRNQFYAEARVRF